MIYAFQVRYSFGVMLRLDDEQRAYVAREVIRLAERQDLADDECGVIAVDDYDLKVVIHFAKRIIHILTREEAEKAGLQKPE